MHKVLVAEPIYHSMPREVYFNRIAFWLATERNGTVEEANELDRDSFDLGRTYSRTLVYRARSYVVGPTAIRTARDMAIREAFKEKATHLFFLDDDIMTPPDILLKLLEFDKPIVGALVHRDNGDPLVFQATSDGGEEVWRDHPKQGVFECAATAVGCMLIKMEVLGGMLNRKGKIVDGVCQYCHRFELHADFCPYEKPRWIFNYDETERSMGVRFCRAAQKHGWTVWCSPDVECTQVVHS